MMNTNKTIEVVMGIGSMMNHQRSKTLRDPLNMATSKCSRILPPNERGISDKSTNGPRQEAGPGLFDLPQTEMQNYFHQVNHHRSCLTSI